MSPNRPFRPFHPLRLVPALAAGALSLAALGGLSACKTVDVSGAGTDTTSQATVDSAVLRITNHLDVDPGTLTFYRFPGTATDFSNAANAEKIGSVTSDGSAVFKVPAGTWKLAYANRAGALTPMEDQASGEWLKAILEKDGDYSLIIASDGPDIRWDATFATDAAPQ